MIFDLQGPDRALAYKLLVNLVIPRPIAWITSRDLDGGINLAPYSFFNVVGSDPPIVVVGVGNERDGLPKHTARNIAATKDFVVNLVTEDLINQMTISAADFPEGESELAAAGLAGAPSSKIATPRVAEAKVALECILHRIDRIGSNNLVIGQVVAIHTADGLVDDKLHVNNFLPVARIGGPSGYIRLTDSFQVPRISYAQLKTETDG